jgi:hypothetical protein
MSSRGRGGEIFIHAEGVDGDLAGAHASHHDLVTSSAPHGPLISEFGPGAEIIQGESRVRSTSPLTWRPL